MPLVYLDILSSNYIIFFYLTLNIWRSTQTTEKNPAIFTCGRERGGTTGRTIAIPRWTKRAAHRLLQRRVKTLNHGLRAVVRHRYPDFPAEEEEPAWAA
jgi:hypothetical protein